MADTTDQYQSYLLRLWKNAGEEGMAWRASLENTVTGEMEGFEDLPGLFAHLRERTETEPPKDGTA